jgi:predicted permease
MKRAFRVGFARLAGLFAGRRRDRDLDREFEAHVQLHADDLVRRGVPADEARRRALAQSGGLEAAKEAYRDRRSVPIAEATWRTAAEALRGLRRRPGYALAIIGSLALGIGANTAMFALIDGVLRRPLPFERSADLVVVGMSSPSGVSWELFGNDLEVWRDRAETLSAVTMAMPYPAVVVGEAGPEHVEGAFGAPNLLAVLGVAPAMGRWFGEDDGIRGAPRVIVISHELWQRQFGGRPDALGRTIKLYDQVHELVGVLPRQGALPLGAQFWLPAAGVEGQVIGRPRPGVSLGAVASELKSLSPTVSRNRQRGRSSEVVVVPLQEQLYGSAAPPITLLFGAAVLMFVIACANVANLSLARAFDRRREWALRTTLGASRGALVALLVTENLVLVGAATALGIAAAHWTVGGFLALAPADLTLPADLAVDAAGVAFACATAVAAAFVVSIAPAVAVWRDRAPRLLADGGTRLGRGRTSMLLRRSLVAAQLATAVVLLVGAGLLVRSLVQLTRVDLGFQPDGVVTASVSLMGERFRDETRVRGLFEAILARVAALPGVHRVSIGPPPLVGGRDGGLREGFNMIFYAPDRGGGDQRRTIWVKYVDASYLETFRIPVRAGRGFVPGDDSAAPRVAVLNETGARLFFPGVDPVGRAFPDAPKTLQPLTVVGVVGDVLQRDVALPAEPEILVPTAQQPMRMSGGSISARTSGDPAALVAPVRRVLRDLDPEMATTRLSTMTTVVDASLARFRFLLVLLGAFAALAVVLASLGLYAVASYLVRQRTREIGVRMALGATRAQVVGLVAREAAMVTTAGLAIGLTAAIALSQLLATFLYGVAPRDGVVLLSVPAILAAATAAATGLPARRASRIDPAATLRAE